MECEKVISFIPEYLEDTLESSKYRKVESHLKECNSCCEDLRAYRKTMRLTSNLSVEYPSKEKWDNFVPELLKKIEKLSEKRTSSLNWWHFIRQYSWQFGTAAISIAIIVTIIFSNFLFVSQPQNEPETVKEVIAENLINNNVSTRQIDQAIKSIDYPVAVGGNKLMYIDEIFAVYEEETPMDGMDIANAIVTEIDSSQLDYDYKLLEAIAYIEKHSISKKE